MDVFKKIVAFEYYFNSIVECSGRHSNPAGSEKRQDPAGEAVVARLNKKDHQSQQDLMIFCILIND